MPEPDFVGAGALHCGTMWWFDLLTAHPQVDRQEGTDRDGGFFAPFAEQQMHDADVERYRDRFRRRPGAIVGEWSGRHLSDIWVHPLLARAAPDARILVLLRDPIERYLMVLARQGADARHMAAVAQQGRYGSQLHSLLRFVDRDRLLVLQLERCRTDPAGELRRTLAFLGIEDDPPPALDLTPPPPDPCATPWPDLLVGLQDLLAPEVALAAELVGDDLDLAWWPHFADQAGRAMMPAWTPSS
jgi:hypothetical protein